MRKKNGAARAWFTYLFLVGLLVGWTRQEIMWNITQSQRYRRKYATYKARGAWKIWFSPREHTKAVFTRRSPKSAFLSSSHVALRAALLMNCLIIGLHCWLDTADLRVHALHQSGKGKTLSLDTMKFNFFRSLLFQIYLFKLDNHCSSWWENLQLTYSQTNYLKHCARSESFSKAVMENKQTCLVQSANSHQNLVLLKIIRNKLLPQSNLKARSSL
jgi:hypothetical protein